MTVIGQTLLQNANLLQYVSKFKMSHSAVTIFCLGQYV